MIRKIKEVIKNQKQLKYRYNHNNNQPQFKSLKIYQKIKQDGLFHPKQL
jgi:hypothetical protein